MDGGKPHEGVKVRKVHYETQQAYGLGRILS